jgi:hypothetical protein
MSCYDNIQKKRQPMTSSHDFDLNATPEMRELLALVQRRLAASPEDAAATQPAFERELRERMLAVERRVNAVDLERLDVDVHGLVVDGVRYRRRGEKTKGEYLTLAGTVEVMRTTYRRRGGHGGETVVPLELRLGLVDGHWTQAAAEAASAFMAAVPSKEAAALLAAAGSMTPSPSHLDRLPKHVSDAWEADRERFEDAVRDAERLDLADPKDVAHIAFSLDGIMLPMKDAPRTPGIGKRDQGPKGHKEVGCATVSLYDAQGERLHTVRFARMPEAYKATLHRQLVAELQAMRARYPTATLQAVADGAQDNWRIIDQIAAELGCDIERTLDYFHAAEHLADGLRAAGAGDEEIDAWKVTLRDAPDAVEKTIEELAVRTSETGRAAVEREFNYFVGQAARIDYAATAAENHPIGSGVQEAACKTLVADRMKRSGMSWREPGGQAILTLRGLAQSGRLAHAWKTLRPALVRRFDIDPNLGRQLPTRAA